MLFLLAILPPQVLVTTSMRFDDDNRNDNNDNTYPLSSLGYNLSPARKDVGPAGYVEGGGGGGKHQMLFAGHLVWGPDLFGSESCLSVLIMPFSILLASIFPQPRLLKTTATRYVVLPSPCIAEGMPLCFQGLHQRDTLYCWHMTYFPISCSRCHIPSTCT